MSESEDLPVDRIIPQTIEFDREKYKKGEALGIGSYGKVVSYTCGEKRVAAKFSVPKTHDKKGKKLSASEYEDEFQDVMERSLREFNHMCALEGISCVSAFTRCEVKGGVYLLLECGIDSLDNYSRGPNMSDQQLIKFGIQMFEGLHYIHSMGIIHGDIKPGNSIIFPNDRIKIGDFGSSFYFFINPQKGHIGTSCFSSISNLKRVNYLEPKDDRYSLCLSLIDCLLPLPWRNCADKKAVLAKQNSCYKGEEDNYFRKSTLGYLIWLNTRGRTPELTLDVFRQLQNNEMGPLPYFEPARPEPEPLPENSFFIDPPVTEGDTSMRATSTKQSGESQWACREERARTNSTKAVKRRNRPSPQRTSTTNIIINSPSVPNPPKKIQPKRRVEGGKNKRKW